MSLPYDTARCEGFYIASKMLPMEGLNLDCIDCLRRTSPGRDQWQSHIAPHDGEGPCPSRIGPREVGLSEVLGVLLNGEETMEYTAKLPTEVGLYRHRWDFRGQMREQVLFVGYTNARAPRLQGSEPNAYMPRKLKCCKPDEHLHADRLTPKEWGGWWARIETPNAELRP